MPDRPDDFDRRLAERLRDYENDFASDAPPIPQASRRWRWPLAVGSAAAAVVAGGIVAAAVLYGPRSEVGETVVSPTPTPTAPAVATPTASDDATPTPTPTEADATPTATPRATTEPTPTSAPTGPAPLAWQQTMASDGSVRHVYAVEWIGERWYLVGSTGLRAAVWHSADGSAWSPSDPVDPEPIELTPEGDPGTAYWITALVEHDGELVAFGWNRIGCCDGGRPIAWRSADGVAWGEIPTKGTGFDGYHFPQAAAIAPTGELVVLSGIGLGSGTSFFVTDDLATWTERPLTEPDTFTSAVDLAASPDLLVAVGQRYEGETPRQEVWTSADGSAWTRRPPPDPGGSLSAVAWDDAHGRFLAAGTDAGGRPAIWLSADAGSWSKVGLSDRPGSMRGIDAHGGLVVGTGSVGDPQHPDPIAWSSHDGITWQVMEVGVAPARAVGVNGTAAVVAIESVGSEPDYEHILEVWLGVR